MSQLVNTNRNDKTLPYQYLTNHDISNSIDLAEESCCFENQDLILSQHFELGQFKTIDKLESFNFKKIELESERDSNPQLYDFVSNFESMLTPVSLLDLDPILKPTLILYQ